MTALMLMTAFSAGIVQTLGFTLTPLNNVPLKRPTAPIRRRCYLPSQRAHKITSTKIYNLYDDWSQDLLSSSQSEYSYDDLILPLDEESIELCLEELMDSDYGKTMFGRHDMAADVG